MGKLDIVQNPNDSKVGIKLDANSQNIILNNANGEERIRVGSWSGGFNPILLGVKLKNANGIDVVELGSSKPFAQPPIPPGGGYLKLKDVNNKATVTLNGDTGDIILANADCAEEFDTSSKSTEIEPGTVMAIDNDGKLHVSSKEYDKRVAGVISGAGDCKPGIVLDKKKSNQTRVPLAMVGKVYCKVDANYSQIKVGDMLTTSSTRGHAMKATNRSKAFGAVIGKALSAIKSGKGLIPILIALQ